MKCFCNYLFKTWKQLQIINDVKTEFASILFSLQRRSLETSAVLSLFLLWFN